MNPFLKKCGRVFKRQSILIGKWLPHGLSIMEKNGASLQTERLYAILFLIFIIVSCSGLPRLKPSDPFTSAEIGKQCLRPFSTGPYRLIHSVEAVFPGGSQINFIGILLTDPQMKSIHSVIMTIEGFVLFDAEFNGTTKINRGVPPFDSIAYAEHMMKDIGLLVFPPEGIQREAGYSADGEWICRFQEKQGMTTDITVTREASWIIRRYNEQDALIRIVKLSRLDERNIPTRIDFEAYGNEGYALHMMLISAEPVIAETIKK